MKNLFLAAALLAVFPSAHAAENYLKVNLYSYYAEASDEGKTVLVDLNGYGSYFATAPDRERENQTYELTFGRDFGGYAIEVGFGGDEFGRDRWRFGAEMHQTLWDMLRVSAGIDFAETEMQEYSIACATTDALPPPPQQLPADCEILEDETYRWVLTPYIAGALPLGDQWELGLKFKPEMSYVDRPAETQLEIVLRF